MMRRHGLGPIVASTRARFRKPVSYPDRLHTGARVIAIADDRVTFEHRLVSERWAEVAAEGECVIVSMDYKAQAKAPLPPGVLERIAVLEAGVKTEKPRPQQ